MRGFAFGGVFDWVVRETVVFALLRVYWYLYVFIIVCHLFRLVGAITLAWPIRASIYLVPDVLVKKYNSL